MRRRTWLVIAAILAGITSSSALAQGLIAPGGGAMHRSMAGASTAVGLDAAGALYWNPAVISGLPGSEVVIGAEMIIPDTHLSSTIPAGAFGPRLGPADTLSGTTRSDSGVAPMSTIGLVYKPDDSPLTFGMGLMTLAAGGVNFPGDANNPILAPTGPLNQFILGSQAASAMVLSMLPTVSYQANERLAIGLGPMLDVMLVSFDPAFFGPTSQARLIDPMQFPSGAHSRPFWGGGVRGGMTYRAADHLVAGASYSSPHWFESWRFNARDASGNAINFRTQLSLPAIVSMGVAYDGIERLLLATDVRYFDYRSTEMLGESPAQAGANWDNIWALAIGGKYQLADRLSVQLGYLYNQNPIPDNLALLNTQLPALIKHTISAGAHYQMNDSIGMSLAYVHGFKNTVSGSVVELLGTNTTIDSEYDSIVFSIHIKYGGSCGRESCTSEDPAVSLATPQ